MTDDAHSKAVEGRLTIATLAAVEFWVEALDRYWDETAVGRMEAMLIEAKLLIDYRAKHGLKSYTAIESELRADAAYAEGLPPPVLHLVKKDD